MIHVKVTSITTWIRNNRARIDSHIKSVCPNDIINDQEREVWIRNDEFLYHMAQSEGVKI